MQYLLHLTLWQENILAIIGYQETIAITMRRDDAFDEIRGICQLQSATPIGFDLSVTLHRSQAPSQAVKLGILHGKRLGDSRNGLRLVIGAQYAEDIFPAGDAVGVSAQRTCDLVGGIAA
jgi:hypothetical protein